MSLFYRIAYTIGFTPWEGAMGQATVVQQIASMFDREQQGKQLPFGRVLDLGCGSGIHAVNLALRGWEVTGVDISPKALARARERAAEAGVEVKFLEGDLTNLQALDLGSNFNLILDFGAVHGMTDAQREATARGVTAVAADDAALLMLAFEPGSRGPLPRGMTAADAEAVYSGWKVTDDVLQDSQLPFMLKRTGANPHWFRLQRGGGAA